MKSLMLQLTRMRCGNCTVGLDGGGGGRGKIAESCAELLCRYLSICESVNNCYSIGVGSQLSYVMSPWLFNIYIYTDNQVVSAWYMG